jgi:type II secretory ATPase GspE/PulE/Tfp pilus assembly ATPase PilB-like protein
MYSLAYLLRQLRARNVLDEEGEMTGIAVQDRGDSVLDFLLQRLPWNEKELKMFISSIFPIELFVDREILIDRKVLHWMNAGLSAKFRCVPLSLEGNQLRIAVDDPFSVLLWQTIENQLNLRADLCLILRSDYQILYQQLYNCTAPPFRQLAEIPSGFPSLLPWALEKEQDELLQILDQAAQKRATDIHFEPLKHALRVRFRIDGRLTLYRMFEAEKKTNFLSRLKIWAEINIAQQRLPQDGQFQKLIGEEEIDFRISTLPLLYGEKAVLRLLRKTYMISSPTQLGMRGEALDQFKALLQRPQGMILVCGPTASGKTTTLYSALQQLDQDTLNIVTIEDPVEFHLAGIQQMQVYDKLHATFAKGLRAILRQDPDVILIGEIRDRETAEVAFQAALTGHLVFASLHTNDAVGAITRLLDMGLEPFLLTSTISGIIAQRLVRKLCPHCAKYEDTDKAYFEKILPNNNLLIPEKIAQAGTGCVLCQQQPLQGRLGIFELLLPDDELQQLIMRKAPLQHLRKHAFEQGMKPFYWDGLEKAALGYTAFSEIFPYFPHKE